MVLNATGVLAASVFVPDAPQLVLAEAVAAVEAVGGVGRWRAAGQGVDERPARAPAGLNLDGNTPNFTHRHGLSQPAARQGQRTGPDLRAGWGGVRLCGMQLPEAPEVADALDLAYSGLTAIVDGLDDFELLLPSGCRGWTIADLLMHVNGDAQGALVALATPTAAPADVNFVDYWHAFPGVVDPEAAAAHAQRVRRTASAFDRPSGVVQIWSKTAPATVRAARAAGTSARLATQGHVFEVADFLAVLVTEAVVHHLDLIDALPEAPEPAPAAAAIARATLDGLAAPALLPESWSMREALLKGTGRRPLSATDHETLGTEAARFPLLG
jgi:mycothiol maleylpyruvate isomerase-like protein